MNPAAERSARREPALREELANTLVHVFGLVGAVLAAVLLGRLATSVLQVSAIAAICGPMIVLFVASALHHGAAAGCHLKRLFLALDHAAVMLLIAGSYSAFALLGFASVDRWPLLIVVWTAAGAGSLAMAGAFTNGYQALFERLAAPFNLALGWIPLLAFGSSFAAALRGWPAALVIGGGIAYTLGAAVYLTRRRWTHAMWHGAVVIACACHAGAIALMLR